MKNLTETQKGIISLIALALVVSSMGLFMRYLSGAFTVLQQVYLRVLAALLIGLVWFYKDLNFQILKRVSFKEWLLLAFRAIAFYLLGVNLFTQAMILTKYSNVSFIRSLPMTAILGMLVLGEKLTIKKTLLVLTAFTGVVLISVKDFSHITSLGRGELFALISIIVMPLTNILRKWHSKLLNDKEITQIMFGVAFLAVFVFSILSGESLPLQNWTPAVIIALLGAGLFNVFIIFLTNYGFQRVKAVLANNLVTLEAFFALVIGFVFYGELPVIKELLGGILIVFSAIKMSRLIAREK